MDPSLGMAFMMIYTLSYVRSASIRSSPLVLLISLSMYLGFGFLWTVSAQIQWTPEAQVNWDDVYDDWMPMVAAGPDGSVWVVWQQSGPCGWKALASVWEGSSWAHPQAVCPDDGIQESLTDIAVGPDNLPWIVLVRLTDDPPYLHYTRWNGVGWDQVQPMFPDLADERVPLAPRIAVDSSGTPWVIWSSYVTEDYDSDLFYSRWNETTWSSPEPVCANSGSGSVNARDIAAGAEGDVWVVWGRHLAPPQHDWAQYMLTSCWQSDSWADPDTVPGGDYGDGIAVGAEGQVWVTTHYDGDIWAAQRHQDGWQQVERVSSPDSTPSGQNASDFWPRVALTSSNAPWIVWEGYNWGSGDFDHEIYFSCKVEGNWIPKQSISTADGFDDMVPDFCISPTGEAWVVWQAWDGSDSEIMYSRSTVLRSMDDTCPQPSTAILCYPNPATDKITFRLSGSDLAANALWIHDCSGRIVAELSSHLRIDQPSHSGPITVHWDRRNSAGVRVPSGCYFVTTRIGRRVSDKGIVILH